MEIKKIDRKEFLSAIGISAVGLFASSCVGCSKSGVGPSAPSNVNITLDLTASAYSTLLNNGGYLAKDGVLIAKTTAGIYIAVQQSCTHEDYGLNYQASGHRFYCNNHGATFNENGVVTSGPTNRSLVVYNTELTGTSLRIFS